MTDKIRSQVEANVVSIYRENRTWKAVIKIGEEVTSSQWTVRLTGRSAIQSVGRDLQSLLQVMEGHIPEDRLGSRWDWPWASGSKFQTNSITGGYDFTVTYKERLGRPSSIIGLEINPGAYKEAMMHFGREANNKKTIHKVNIPEYDLIHDRLPQNQSYFLKGTVVSISDGDTIRIRADEAGEEIEKRISIGNEYVIRFAGINAPETPKVGSNKNYGEEERNAEFARQFKIPLGDPTSEENPGGAFQAGIDAKNFVESVLSTVKYRVIIDLDTYEDGNLKIDSHNRYIGIVYADPYFSAYQINPPSSPNDVSIRTYPNLNKSLMANPSSIDGPDGKVPLAISSATYTYDEYTRFEDTYVWDLTIGYNSDNLTESIQQSTEAYKQEEERRLRAERERLLTDNKKTVRTLHSYIVPKNTTLNVLLRNLNDQGMTTTVESIKAENNLTEDDLDVLLQEGGQIYVSVVEEIPQSPLNRNQIEVNTRSDQVANNLHDFFEAKDDRPPLTTDYHLRIGDVEMVVPPLSIQINRESHLQKIKTLRSRSSIITKVGSSTTTITLQLYFHDLESINGRKVGVGPVDGNGRHQEYYYVDGLRPLIAQFKKAPFLGVENEYLNEVHNIYSVALINLSVSTVPNFPHSLAATLTLAKFEQEAYMPHVSAFDDAVNFPMFRWYYQQALKDPKSPYRTYLAPIENQLTNDFVFTMADEDALIERRDAMNELRFMSHPLIFQESTEEGDSNYGKLIRDWERFEKAKEQLFTYLKIKSEGRIPEEGFTSSDDVYKEIYGESYVDHGAMFIPPEYRSFPDVPKDGLYSLELESEANKNLIESYEIEPIYQNRYRIARSTEYANFFKMIVRNGESAKLKVDNYENSYYEIKSKAEQTEGELPMNPYPIEGFFITSLNVIYENSFSSAQLPALDTPTLQYLGAQDPYIYITLETQDRNAIKDLKHLLEEAERYSREYRYGITSGFIGFENQLTRLFGIQSVIPESVAFNTVPGFPNRFQVQLALCGFDKTQKRSEMLEGFSAVDPDKQDLEDRHISSSSRGNDAIVIDRKLRDLEVYPDLELPTYEELNKALKYINAGISTYHNPGGAKYVDPDFYIATEWTMRRHIWNIKNQKSSSNMEDRRRDPGSIQISDLSGISGFTYVPDSLSDQVWVPDDESYYEHLSRIDERMRTTIVPDIEVPSLVLNEESGRVEGVSTGPTDRSSVKQWLQDPSNIFRKPSPELFAEWQNIDLSIGAGGINDAYNRYFKEIEDLIDTPEWDLEVYKEIYKWLDFYFTDDGLVIDDRERGDELYWLTYAPIPDIYRASYQYLKKRYPGTYGYEGDIEEPVAFRQGQFDRVMDEAGQSMPMITRERLANYIKAVFNIESHWRQFKKDASGNLIPNKNPGSSAIGIGQIMLSQHANNIQHAQRLAWDWKYNVRHAVGYLKQKYMEAAAAANSLEITSHPWDWMVRAYEQGNITSYHVYIPSNASEEERASKESLKRKYTGELATPYYGHVYNLLEGESYVVDYEKRKGALYNYPSGRFTTANYPQNNALIRYLNNFSAEAEAILQDDREAIIANIIEARSDLHWSMDAKMIEKYSDEYLQSEERSLEELKEIFEEVNERAIYWKEYTRKYQRGYSKGRGPEVRRKAEEAADAAINPQYRKTYEAVSNYEETKKDISQQLAKHLLVNADNPGALFRDSFTDMTEYDQRGRLIRAFPTFQMFIIDEGRWMSSYKLWDNLYGFNAIQSIDVHRDRKIAADTAVIKMTNIYSNLTSREIDADYGDWDYSWWDNLFLKKPSESIIEARKELAHSLMLKTGARIHLRLGYSSNASDMPVVFNGTITELDTQDLVTIIAQGDGIELTNPISFDPKETNDPGFLRRATEPSDFLRKLFTSKGNWMKNVLNRASDGLWYEENPLGIQHFGNPQIVPESSYDVFKWYISGSGMGEATQNIYSSNGANTFSQWTYEDGSPIGWSWFEYGKPIVWPKGDEANIELKLFNKTVWDIAQTIAYCSPDYIAAVHPFELRSTLFFGKPYYKLAYRYDSIYTWDAENSVWQRDITAEYRKPYCQYHIYDSNMDIISNQIKASEEGIYTNVVARFDGGKDTTSPQMADADIRIDKQRTVVIDSPIVGNFGPNFFSSEKQAEFYARSALRDYMKDMYKGKLVILGDPSVKPYDLCYMNDIIQKMDGPFLVKNVTHHFSQETGFITTISPDALVINDDTAMLSQATWLTSVGMGVTSYLTGMKLTTRTFNKLIGGTKRLLGSKGIKAVEDALFKAANYTTQKIDGVNQFINASKEYRSTNDPNIKKAKLEEMNKIVKEIEDQVENMDLVNKKGKVDKLKKTGQMGAKGLLSMTKGALENLSGGRKSFHYIRTAGLFLISTTGIGLIASLGLSIAAETISEMYRRRKRSRQSVIILPLNYQGRQYTAGINGHQGMVVGDQPGKLDQFFMGGGASGALGQTLNFLLDDLSPTGSVDYSLSYRDLDEGLFDEKGSF